MPTVRIQIRERKNHTHAWAAVSPQRLGGCITTVPLSISIFPPSSRRLPKKWEWRSRPSLPRKGAAIMMLPRLVVSCAQRLGYYVGVGYH